MIWTIERLGRKGDGVALSGNDKALAPLTLPGEVIEGEAADGRIAAPRIVTPSPDRVRAPCPHYRACGGCSLMHGSESFLRDWKVGVVTQALRAQGLAAPVAGVHVSPPRSRRRAVLSGRRTKKGALLGFHARASDVIVDIADCMVLRPAILAALPLLRELVVAGGTRAGEMALTVTETGFGKRSSAYEYRRTGRGGQGLTAHGLGGRAGTRLAAAFPVEESDDLMLVTDGGQMIRTPVSQVRIVGRSSQGVTIFRTGKDEKVVSVERLADSGGDDEDGEVNEASTDEGGEA